METNENKKLIRWYIPGAIGGIFTVVVALAIHTWSATLAWFTAYLGPRIGAEAAIYEKKSRKGLQ